MNGVQIVLGGVGGLVAGVGTWAIAQRLIARYLAESVAQAAPLVPPNANPSAPSAQAEPLAPQARPVIGAALAFMFFGAYVGWRASRWELLPAALIVTGLLIGIS